MNTDSKRCKSIRIVVFAAILVALTFISCQKANPEPYSDPPAIANYDNNSQISQINPSFTASVSNSSVISFTPGKSISGSNTSLIGTSTYYTITITFPSSTGPGTHTIGTSFSPNIVANIVNGSNFYCVNAKYGLGSLSIDSISSNGKYYGTFQFDAEDTVSHANLSVSQGAFYRI